MRHGSRYGPPGKAPRAQPNRAGRSWRPTPLSWVRICAKLHRQVSPFLDRGKWEATVRKMIGPLGAPIDAKDVPAILDYLAKNYGSS
jgi:hypothetical protein